ncbi:MAG: ferrochelatase [Thermomicrobiales bacterium]
MQEQNTPIGILLMAYGTPETPADVEAYFTHIRGGKTPPPERVERLKDRYNLVGGRTPLLAITEEVRAKLETALNNAPSNPQYRVYAGMKHWHPFIADVMARMAADGIKRIIAVALAPHYSRISIGGYRKAVEEGAAKLGDPFEVTFVDSWHLQPEYLDLIADHIRAARQQFPAERRDDILTVFSAHSLPERIRTWDDPYESQLLASSAAVADRLGLNDWRFAWQSAGETGEPWIGPDICDYLETLHAEGVRDVLSVPIGFVADHLEIMYDLDHEATNKANELGMTLHRTAMPNATPAFIANLQAIVAEYADQEPAIRPAVAAGAR